MTSTTARTLLPLLTLGLALAACDKDEPLDPPIDITSAAPVASVDLEPDAGAGGEGGAGGSDGGSGGAESEKKPTGPWDPLRISRCCDALQSNREGAPPMQKGAYDLAISACNQAKKNPATIHRVRQLVPGIPACQ